MSKTQYLQEVRARLSNRISVQELESIMDYYAEYFDEAGVDRERQVMLELGPPADLVRQIMGETVIRALDQRSQYQGPRRRWGLGSVWTVILAIFAAPIAIPLSLALVLAAFGMVIGVLAVVLALGLSGVCCVLYGFFSAFCGITAMFSNGITTTMHFAGGGMVVIGIGCLLIVGTAILGGVCCKGIVRFLGRALPKGEMRV